MEKVEAIRSDGTNVSPRARSLAEKRGISLLGITGSGPDGRIIEGDVQAAIGTGRSYTRAAALRIREGKTRRRREPELEEGSARPISPMPKRSPNRVAKTRPSFLFQYPQADRRTDAGIAPAVGPTHPSYVGRRLVASFPTAARSKDRWRRNAGTALRRTSTSTTWWFSWFPGCCAIR